jgi:uncharacterized protein (TIGR02001 family)
METKIRKLSVNKILFILIFLSSFLLNAQNDSIKKSKLKTFFSSIDLGADLKSRYIWRGINLGGHTASIQPFIEYNFAKGWEIGVWGAYSFGEQPNQEVDIYIGYTTPDERLNFTFTNYFFPDYSLRNNHYFDFSSDSGHVFELMGTYFPFKKVPLSFSVATNFYGADKQIDEEGNPLDKQSFSTYIEADYSTSLATVGLDFFIAGVVNNRGKYYGDEENAFINIGMTASRAIKITDRFSLPVDASLIFNPDQGNIFVVFGISI